MTVQVFGGGAVQTAYPSYLALDITLNSLTLVWADAYVDVPYTDPNTGISYQALAAYMDVTTPLINVNTITLPNATQTSVGQNFIISNVGASNFLLNTADGNLLQEVDTGIKYYAILTDNSTAAGEWSVATFGAGISEASAVALAGNGLVPLIDKLNTNIAVVSINTPPTIDITYRAKLIVWTGGASTIILPTIGNMPGDVPAGYYVSFSNQGSAQVIIQPVGALISGQTNIAVQVQQSLTIVSDGTNWQTLGFGQNQFAADTVLILDVSSSIDVTLTSIQASNIIQKYVGTLTNNITISFPSETSNWFISNNTSGNFELSVQLVGSLLSYNIPQGSVGIFYSDGTHMFSAPTAVLSLIDGTAATPALSFNSSPDTGLWFDSLNNALAFTMNGTTVVDLGTVGGVSVIALFDVTAGKSLLMLSSNTDGGISYNNILAINIDTTGVVTLPAAPLPINSGGTNANNQPAAINNLMPAAAMGGIPYFDGVNWQILDIGANGNTLEVVGGLPAWV